MTPRDDVFSGDAASRTRRGRRVDPSATRQAILDATIEVMADGGEAAVRVADIARAAGVTTGAIYAHFTNRDELIAAANLSQIGAVVEHVRERLLDRGTREHSNPYLDGAYLEDVRSYLTGDGRAHFLQWAAVATKAETDPDLSDATLPFERELVNAMTEQMKSMAAAGYLSKDIDPRAAAVMRLGTIVGVIIAMRAYLADDPTFIDTLLEVWRPMTGIGPVVSDENTSAG